MDRETIISNLDVNLEYYKIFYHVVKSGQITAAAQILNMSQPAVSQQISSLEKQLNVSLFKRSGRGIVLTKEGKLLYEYVQRGYEEILQGQRRLSQFLHMESGEVRVGASDMTLRFFLLPYLEKFHQLYPGIKVTVTNGPTPETLKYLEEDHIDFGVVSSPFPKSLNQDDISYFDVREIQDCFVAGRSFIQYKNHMLDLSELENLPLIALEGNTSSGRYVTEFLEQNKISIHPEFELATSDMIVQFAERSLGVGMVVRDFAKEDIECGKLFELRFKQRIPPRHIRLVTSSKYPQSLASAKLLELIKPEGI